jgi:hypothetical protein
MEIRPVGPSSSIRTDRYDKAVAFRKFETRLKRGMSVVKTNYLRSGGGRGQVSS